MKHKTFLVVSYAHSGTAWLAKMLDAIDPWTVKLDPGESLNLSANTQSIQFRFSRDLYGEVNKYLRHCAMNLCIRSMAVLIRDPRDVWTSIMAHQEKSTWSEHSLLLLRAYRSLLELKDRYPARAILFERITEDRAYYESTAKYLTGSKYIYVPKDFYVPVNATGGSKPDYDDAPKDIKAYVERARQTYNILRSAVKK